MFSRFSIVAHCFGDNWFCAKTLNRVAAPFALSMTSLMIQKASNTKCLKQLESFTNINNYEKNRILKGKVLVF